MIEINYSPKKSNKLTMKGHAVGKDDVCTAASILCYTLAETLESVKPMLKKNTLKLKAEEGNAEISCRPRPEFRPNVDLIYYTILNGYQLLAESYPEHVHLNVEELPMKKKGSRKPFWK